MTADVDDIVICLKMRLDSQLSRMNCQIFSIGLSSGDFGGKAMSEILSALVMWTISFVFVPNQ